MWKKYDVFSVPVCLYASHIAYGSLRMEPVFMMPGEGLVVPPRRSQMKLYFGKSGPGGVHAPSATPCPEGTGDVIIIFNMNPALAIKGWNQIMTLPRRLTLVSRNEIGIEPAGNLEALRHNHVSQPATKLPANQEIIFNQVSGNAMEVFVEFDPKDAQTIELNMLRSPNKEEFTRIIFYKNKGFSIKAYGKDAELISLDAWQMKNIWDVSLDEWYSKTVWR